VRPTDLIASSTARIAGRGINFQTELAHRVRARQARHTVRPGTVRATFGIAVRNARSRRVFESFDVFEPQDRPRSSSWVRPSGIGLG
jgi:RimJ/RimL family protein N-acetyltransferase